MGASASTLYTQGGSWGLKFVPTYDLMEQVHTCLVPSERDFLLACLDEMHCRCDSLLHGRKQVAAFHEQGAVEALLEMLGMFKLDEVFLRQAVRTLIPLCGQDDAVLDHFLDLGGRVALDETLGMHTDDHHMYCSACRPLVDCPDLLGPAGNRLSSDSVQRCLQRGAGKRLVYRGSSGNGPIVDDVEDEDENAADPTSDDLVRIRRLVEHMEKFPKTLDVVEPCVDALIAVGKSAATQAVLESTCVFKLVKAMKTFANTRSLQWKGLLAIIHFAKKDEVCFDLGKAGVIPLLVAMWPQWDDDEMRQLLLWAFNELRMSVERVGALLREAMEPAPARLAVTGAMVTAEQVGHYCVPVKLKRLYRERKLGSPFAKGDEEANRENEKNAAALARPLTKAQFGKAGDGWKEGEHGLL
ncbi:hypothetical protein Esi_0411_0009 [Ectocarpus siliculosus]|uniref:Uncharacterized protein n=1 Tax=Ectocarpus siliculosus TaxID=2880 RepID=D7G0L4_ECTSI|nr:hypothetical protein Esi_0411_0009 [Ectocarpus siliculosus]|eukprot:CBJ33043.1 hypothetical protein Esi_0411_0009 [Ectocarpus siliculosus]